MITPSKTIPLKESAIFKMTFILDEDFDEMSARELYMATKKKFSRIEEFIYSVDALFVLGKIELDETTGKIKKC